MHCLGDPWNLFQNRGLRGAKQSYLPRFSISTSQGGWSWCVHLPWVFFGLGVDVVFFLIPETQHFLRRNGKQGDFPYLSFKGWPFFPGAPWSTRRKLGHKKAKFNKLAREKLSHWRFNMWLFEPPQKTLGWTCRTTTEWVKGSRDFHHTQRNVTNVELPGMQFYGWSTNPP